MDRAPFQRYVGICTDINGEFLSFERPEGKISGYAVDGGDLAPTGSLTYCYCDPKDLGASINSVRLVLRAGLRVQGSGFRVVGFQAWGFHMMLVSVCRVPLKNLGRACGDVHRVWAYLDGFQVRYVGFKALCLGAKVLDPKLHLWWKQCQSKSHVKGLCEAGPPWEQL